LIDTDKRTEPHSPASSEDRKPALDWYAHQVGLKKSTSEVLILLETYAFAGSLASSKGFKTAKGHTELITACGFDVILLTQAFNL